MLWAFFWRLFFSLFHYSWEDIRFHREKCWIFYVVDIREMIKRCRAWLCGMSGCQGYFWLLLRVRDWRLPEVLIRGFFITIWSALICSESAMVPGLERHWGCFLLRGAHAGRVFWLLCLGLGAWHLHTESVL